MIDFNEMRYSIMRFWLGKSLPESLFVIRTHGVEWGVPEMIGDMISWENEEPGTGWKVASLDMKEYSNEHEGDTCSKSVGKRLMKYLNGQFIKELKSEDIINGRNPAGMLYTTSIYKTNLSAIIDKSKLTPEKQEEYNIDKAGALVIMCTKMPRLKRVKIKELKMKDFEED